jgi:hypothetical protein
MTEQVPFASETDPTTPQSPQDIEDLDIANLESTQAQVGYHVEMLADGADKSPVPAREALLLDKSARGRQFAAGCADGTVPIEIVNNSWDTYVRKGEPGFVAFLEVDRTAVEATGIAPEVFTDGKFQHPGADEKAELAAAGDEAKLAAFAAREEVAAKLDTLITPEQKQVQIAKYYEQQADKVDRLYIDDLSGVEKQETGLETLHQAFEFTDNVEGETVGGIRVLNFTETEMTGEHVGDIARALQYFSERTGGAIYDNFDNIVFVPKDHPSLKVTVKQADGTPKEMTRRGYMAPRTLVMSEWVLYTPEDQPEATAESTAFFHSYLHPDEPAEGPGAPVKTVAQGRFKATVAHEMTHMALFRDDMPTTRSLYSRFNPVEWDAERGAAEYLREEHLVPLDPHDPSAYDKFQHKWEWLRHKAAQDGRPQGTHFVGAQQHDLTTGPLPRRAKNPGQPLPTELTYRLKSDS